MDDDNNDFGRSHTIALMFSPVQGDYRIGTELMYLESDRPRTMDGGQLVNEAHAISVSALFSMPF